MDEQQNPVENDNGEGFSGEFTGFLDTGLTDADLNADLNMPDFGLLNSNGIPSEFGSGDTTDAIHQQLDNRMIGNSNPFPGNGNGDIAGSAQPQSQQVATLARIQGNMTADGQSSWFDRAPSQEMQQFAPGAHPYSYQQDFLPSGQGLFRFNNSLCSLHDSFDPPSDNYLGGNENMYAGIPGAFNQVNPGTAWPHPGQSMAPRQGGADMAFSKSPFANSLGALVSHLEANDRAWDNVSFKSSLVGDRSLQNESQHQLERNVDAHNRQHSGSFKLMRPEMVGDEPEQEPQNQFVPFMQQDFANGGQQMPQTTAQPPSMGHTHLKSHQVAAPKTKVDHSRFFPSLSAGSMGINPTVPLRLDTSTTPKIDLTGVTPLEPSKDPQKLHQLFSVAIGVRKNALEKAKKKRKNPDEVAAGRVKANREDFKKLNQEYKDRIAKSGSTPAGTPYNKVSNKSNSPPAAGVKHDSAPPLAQQAGSAPASSTVARQDQGPVVSAATVANALKNLDPTTKKLIDCAFYLGTLSGASDAVQTYHYRLVDSAENGMGELTVRGFLGIPKEVMKLADNDPRKQEAVLKGVEKSRNYHYSCMKHQSPDSSLCTGKIRSQDMTKLVARVPEFFAKTEGEPCRTSSDFRSSFTRSASAATAVVADGKSPSPGLSSGGGVPTTDGNGFVPRVPSGDAFQGQMEIAMNGHGHGQPSLSPTMNRDVPLNWAMPGQPGIQSSISDPALAHQADGAARDTAGNGLNITGIDAPAAQPQTPPVGESGVPGGSSPFQINSGRAHVDQDALKTQTKSDEVEAPKPGGGKKRSASKASHFEEQETGSKSKRKRTYNKKKNPISTSTATVEKKATLSPQSGAALSNDTSGISAAANALSTESAVPSSNSMTARDAEQAKMAPPKGYNTWLKSLAVPRPPLSQKEHAEIDAMLAEFGIDNRVDFIDINERNDFADIDAL